MKAINNNNSKNSVSKNNDINKRDSSNSLQYEMLIGLLNLSKQWNRNDALKDLVNTVHRRSNAWAGCL
jgi:23S rRNA maturation mini-RNase III